MAFDFNRPLSEDGEIDEEALEEYAEELMQVFADSPEVREHVPEEVEIGCVMTMIEYGCSHLGVTPATMTAAELQEVLFNIIPRKVSCEPDVAPEIVRELRAFWLFVGREFGAANAAACLKILEGDAADRPERALGDPSKFGMAKGFVMMGKKAGFDMTTKKGIDEWMLAYNAALDAPRPGVPSPFLPSMASSRSPDASSARRKKRKMQRASRKRNR